jgi:hypothetical protein
MNSFICKLKGNQRYNVTEISFSRGVKKADGETDQEFLKI